MKVVISRQLICSKLMRREEWDGGRRSGVERGGGGQTSFPLPLARLGLAWPDAPPRGYQRPMKLL